MHEHYHSPTYIAHLFDHTCCSCAFFPPPARPRQCSTVNLTPSNLPSASKRLIHRNNKIIVHISNVPAIDPLVYPRSSSAGHLQNLSLTNGGSLTQIESRSRTCPTRIRLGGKRKWEEISLSSVLPLRVQPADSCSKLKDDPFSSPS